MCAKISKTSFIIVLMLLAIALIGCSESAPVEQSEEPEYAGEIIEEVLQAYNTGDYAMYSKRFDTAMKEAMSEFVFQQTHAFNKNRIGDYVSREFVDSQVAEEIYTVVIYHAKFTDEPADVKITVNFLETDDYVYVSGLYFSSPKLWGR